MVALRSTEQIIGAEWKPAANERGKTREPEVVLTRRRFILLPEQPTSCAADSVGDFWAQKLSCLFWYR